MPSVTRRSLLSTIASVPFLSKLSKADIQSNDINALKPEEVGKRILRAVNTAQHWLPVRGEYSFRRVGTRASS
jgi:hypothetical protein